MYKTQEVGTKAKQFIETDNEIISPWNSLQVLKI